MNYIKLMLGIMEYASSESSFNLKKMKWNKIEEERKNNKMKQLFLSREVI